MRKSLTTIGIDPSLSSTGLVVYSNNKVVAHCNIKTNNKSETEQRIFHICLIIASGIKKFHPDFIIMEGYSFASIRSKSATFLHELGGAIKQILHAKQIPWDTIAPTSLKAYAGHGHASKTQMIEWAQKLWPKCPNQSDVADAFWCAKYAYEKYEEIVTPA